MPSSHLFSLARNGDWDGLVQYVENMENDGDDVMLWEPGITNATILHTVCHNASVPPRVIETLLDKNKAWLLERNWMGQTPLHVACSFGAHSRVIELLAAASPDIVRMQDNEHLRPLDVLIQKIIMKEERARYIQTHNDAGTTNNNSMEPNNDAVLVVDDLWRSCKILVQAHANSIEVEQPMIHLCIQIGNECPVALWDRVLKRFANDLQTPNSPDCNLPLHIAAAHYPNRPKIETLEEQEMDNLSEEKDGEEADQQYERDDEEEEPDHLYEILSLYPQAAQQRNFYHQLPLYQAVRNGRTWDTGVMALLQAYPAAVESLWMDLCLYPKILAHLANCTSDKEAAMSVLYGVLLAKPDLFSHVNNTKGKKR